MMVALGANSNSSPRSRFSFRLVKLSSSFFIVLMSLFASCFFFCSVPVVEVTFGSESVSCGGGWSVGLEETSIRAESGFGEQVVELASPFSTPM